MVAHGILLCGVLFLITPIVLILVASTHTSQTLQQHGFQLIPGGNTLENYRRVFSLETGFFRSVTPITMLKNSMLVAIGTATFTTLFSVLSAYVIVFGKMRWANVYFWVVILTLMYPLESRFITTFKVVSDLGLTNTHTGVILPGLAAALGTFFFRQYFRTVPKELQEAATLDGAGFLRFFLDIVLPASWQRAGVVFVISFMIGWNQYLWPLLITTDPSMNTIVMGIKQMFPSGDDVADWPVIMATSILAMIPPVIVVVSMQKLFIRGLVDSEK